MKRNLIKEIKGIKERRELTSRVEIIDRLETIESIIKRNLKIQNELNFLLTISSDNNHFKTGIEISDFEHDMELLKFLPIATIACFESFFRSIIKELIDFGKPYSDNVVNFNQLKNVKFDFDIINAIQNKTVTVGEFISHILPFNSLDDINSNLTILTGFDFMDSIKKFKKKSLIENEEEKLLNFSSNINQIIGDVKQTFELRHIFCHEFGNNIKFHPSDILRCLSNSKIFLTQTNDFIWHLLYPNAPLTQTDMSAQASEAFQKIDSELSDLISHIKKIAPDFWDEYFDEMLFEESIKQWKIYRDAKAKSDSAGFEGGTMYPMVYTLNLTNITNDKIQNLKTEFEIAFRKYSSR